MSDASLQAPSPAAPATVSAPAVPAAPAPAALTPEQIALVAEARRRSGRVRRAAGVAAFSGWTMVIIASLSILGGLFSLKALLFGVGLGATGWLELRGGRRLRAFDVSAPGHLALNQLFVAIVVLGYAGWSIGQALLGPSVYAGQMAAAGGEVAGMLEGIDDLHRTLTVAFYAIVIVASLAAQGGAALYYITRRRHVVACLRETPAWVVQTLQAAG